jgi:hypothetical protein
VTTNTDPLKPGDRVKVTARGIYREGLVGTVERVGKFYLRVRFGDIHGLWLAPRIARTSVTKLGGGGEVMDERRAALLEAATAVCAECRDTALPTYIDDQIGWRHLGDIYRYRCPAEAIHELIANGSAAHARAAVVK